MSRPTPEELITEWERKKAVKSAEREVLAAAEKWAEGANSYLDLRYICGSPTAEAIFNAIRDLREVRGGNAG
jgi:hypothetical protein